MASHYPTSFDPFSPSTETWDAFVQRFEVYLLANDYTTLSEARKRACFLNVCGQQMFSTARALVAPQVVYSVPWDELMQKLKNHYAPAPSRIARRFAFQSRRQAEGQSINQYIASLRDAALECQFSDLDDALLVQFVCGVRDLHLQRQLLAQHDLTLATALDKARAAEMSTTSAAEIQRLHVSITPSSLHNSVHQTACDPPATAPAEDVNRLLTMNRPRRNPMQPRSSQPRRLPMPACDSCGDPHPRSTCRFLMATCRRCGKAGHLAKVCRSAPPSGAVRPPPPHRMPAQLPDQRESCFAIWPATSSPEIPEEVFLTAGGGRKKLSLTVSIEGVPLTLEVDTGSSRSLISWQTLTSLLPSFPKARLLPSNVLLRDYQGNTIPILGQVSLHVTKDSFAGYLPMVVVAKPLPSLLGLDWFSALGLSIMGVHSLTADPQGCLLQEFQDVFKEGLGCYVGTPISLCLDPMVPPIRLKPRRVPLALKAKVDVELDKLIAQGVLEPTDHACWETPIVVPLRPDGSLRICGDYKSTLNKALQSHPYPVPVVQHLLHSLGKGSIFAKLDLAQAYQQLPVDDTTAEAQTLVTHRGAFKCRRLQFGVSVAPGIFQNLMERLLYGLPGVVPYFDDILISANSSSDLIARVRAVLLKFRQAGLRLKRHKCQIGVPSVEFLGYLIDANGIHPTPAKVAAIQQAPTPSSKGELQAFLGLLNFYSVFLPHKASIAEPLHRLLDSKTPWNWSPEAQASFEAVKQLLSSDAVLVQYDQRLPVTLAADASPYGVGAVLSHLLPSGYEAPIAYFSRTLSAPERNYSQTDKEALAIVAATKKFHHYLYGRPFTIITDHKPLLGRLPGDRQTPQIISPRLARWAEFLAAYDYSLTYRPGKSIAHADALSRCPLPLQVQDPSPAADVLLVEELGGVLTASDIAAHSAKDPVLAKVLDWVRRGWPTGPLDTSYTPFVNRQQELSTLGGCLLWGSRVVVPSALRSQILQQLHNCHPGIVRMKGLGRSYVWWPGLDQDIERWVAQCSVCQASRPAPPVSEPRVWEVPRSPWSRIHVDFAGPFHGRQFLVLVDAYSGWVEVEIMNTTTTDDLIRKLQRLFATHGLPDSLVSDNGPQFTSAMFQQFLASLGIRQVLTAPWHPASNGRAERAVRFAKESLSRLGGTDWHNKVAQFLLAQHSTPNPLTNRSPAEALMNRRLRVQLDRIHPSYAPVAEGGALQAARGFQPGDKVFARGFGGDPRWLPATVLDVTGPCSYRVQLSDGRCWRRHIDQLRRCSVSDITTQPKPDQVLPRPSAVISSQREVHAPAVQPLPTPQATTASPASALPQQPGPPTVPLPPPGDKPQPAADTPRQLTPPVPVVNDELRRSERARKRPSYLNDFVCSCQVGRSVVSGQKPGRFPLAKSLVGVSSPRIGCYTQSSLYN